MQVTVQIHEAWLARPEDLRRIMALLAGLEVPPPSGAGPRQTAAAPAPDPEDYEEPFYPEERALARPTARPDRGDAWKPPTRARTRRTTTHRRTGGSCSVGRRSRSRT